ncbi:MAG: carboxylesterase/lipase family protein, partial [Bacteroidales bacterium]|nr:carboxylesterase/lipase family protein [Bacteroidales bacterium]
MKKLSKILVTVVSATVFIACTGTDKQQNNSPEINASTEASVVATATGKVAGYIDEGIYIYKGIPYAKAERFAAPQQADAWEGVRSSRAYGPTAPQGKRTGWYSDDQAFVFDWNDGFPDEDCLRVNIWTPGVNDGKKRPVMVWLHGGGYSAGSGQELPSYDGLSLAKSGDVVVVSLNHRLNVLGYLDLSSFGEEYSKTGNLGTLDMIAALKWVKENIASFGGDASNVTIFGQSGGGGKVTTLLATPSAQGLFHKAIVQSGSILTNMTSEWARKIGEMTAKELGLTAKTINKIKTVPYEQLLAAGEKAVAEVRKQATAAGFEPFLFGWTPVVDGDFLPSQLNTPESINLSKDIPVMVGSTVHEFMSSQYFPELRELDEAGAIELLRRTRYGDRVDEYVEIFKNAYPEGNVLDLMETDYTFRPFVVDQASARTNIGNAPVYMYLFTWTSPVMDGIFRSTHCMEIPFVFNNADLHASMTGGGEEAIKLAEIMSGAWISFARTGNPNTDRLPEWP